MTKEVTMMDIAQHAGVSVSTVSLVVNRQPNVSAKMIRRVVQAMQELNYHAIPKIEMPRPGQPRRRKTKRVALYLLGLSRMILTDSIFAEVVAGAREGLRENGLSLILGDVPSVHHLSQELASCRCDGLLLLGGQMTDVVASAWRMPCVRLMSGFDDADATLFDHVCVSEASTARLAADYLLSKGHKHCAFLGRGRPNFTGEPRDVFELRQQVFRERLEREGVTVQILTDPDLVEIRDDIELVRHETLAKMMDRLAAASPRPTGMMLYADFIAFSAYQHMLERGIRPGSDIEIVSCDNEKRVISSLHPIPVEVDTQAFMIGKKGVEQLIARIENPSAPAVKLAVEPTILTYEDGFHAPKYAL